jgi:hypothetical protein
LAWTVAGAAGDNGEECVNVDAEEPAEAEGKSAMGQLRETMMAAAWAAGALALGLGLALLTEPAQAGSFGGTSAGERVYDDSYGNLVIISPSGYKRIVVGMGHLAAELERDRAPEVVYLDRHGGIGIRCHTPPVLWKGRSYMYGLAEGEIPTPPRVCD